MGGFPRTTVGGVSLSRMIIGTNWFLGFSHTTAAKDEYLKAKIAKPREDRGDTRSLSQEWCRHRHGAHPAQGAVGGRAGGAAADREEKS